MKKRLPSFLAGMLTATVIGSLGVTALAATGMMNISVAPMRIQVNGEVFVGRDAQGNEVPVFSYNGTTYAPLRALAESFGLTVGYDKENDLATVTGSAAAVPSATPAPATLTRAVDMAVEKSYTVHVFGIGNTFDGEDVSKADTMFEDGLIVVDGISYINCAVLLSVPEQSEAFSYLQTLVSGSHGQVTYKGREYISYHTVHAGASSALSLFSDGKELSVLSVVR